MATAKRAAMRTERGLAETQERLAAVEHKLSMLIEAVGALSAAIGPAVVAPASKARKGREQAEEPAGDGAQ